MQKDVDKARETYRKLNAEPLFDHHVLKVLNYALDENIVTASEVEKPREKLNRELELLILYDKILDISSVPWGNIIGRHMKDSRALRSLDADPDRSWADYARLLRRKDGSLPVAVLAVLAEKAIYQDIKPPIFYGMTQKSAPGVRVPGDLEHERKVNAEPNLVVWRKMANLLNYRDAYNRIGASAIQYLDKFQALIAEVKAERARLAPAIGRTAEALRNLMAKVCDGLSACGVRYRIEMRDEKGEASQVLKLKKYRDKAKANKDRDKAKPKKEREKGDGYNCSVVATNDNVAARIIIQRNEGAMTENLAGVRTAQRILFEQADPLRAEGVFPYLDVKSKNYIVKPKPNGYRADHHDLRMAARGDRDPDHVNVEVQVLTQEMYDFNRHGGAAHIAYKDDKDQEGMAGMGALRSTLLANWHRMCDDLEAMQGKGSRTTYQPFPRSAEKPVKDTVVMRIQRNGATERFQVAHEAGDRALDLLARSGLDIRSHALYGGVSFSDEIAPNAALDVVERPDAVCPELAAKLYRSTAPYKPLTRTKLSEVVQDLVGKRNGRKNGKNRRR
jgi:hypothetical protein